MKFAQLFGRGRETALNASKHSVPEPTQHAADRLAPLRRSYLQRLERRVEEIAAYTKLLGSREFTAEELTTIHRTAHSMVSSSAIYGYGELSVVAKQAELVLEETAASRDERRACLRGLVESVITVLATSKD